MYKSLTLKFLLQIDIQYSDIAHSVLQRLYKFYDY